MTTTTTEWAHLPNAALIDRVIADVAQRPEVWDEAWDAAREAVWAAAWAAAWGAAWDAAGAAVRGAARRAAWGAARRATRGAARGVILALVAWDDASLMLDMPVPALRLYAANGSPVAILILPAAIALGDHS